MTASWKTALLICAGLATSVATSMAATDLSAIGPDEVVALQRRLADAGCYSGPTDGKASAAMASAVKACPDMQPMLRVDTSMHAAAVVGIGVDAGCRLAATASDDKTVRLWSLPDGKPVRTQRLPIGEHNGGKLYAVAMSPDGTLVAAAGWDAYSDKAGGHKHGIYLFDAANGAKIRRLGDFGNVIQGLTFSKDGTRLAAGLGGSEGVRVFEASSGRELMADREYSALAAGVAFAADGSLYAVGFDGYLRRYGSDLKRNAKIKVRDEQPRTVAVDPTGKKLAIGYLGSTAVEIFDAATLKRRTTADTKGITDGDLGSVVWSADGKLYAAGSHGDPRVAVVVFDGNGQRLGSEIGISNNSITLQRCADAVAFAAHDPSFGLIRPDRGVVVLGASPIPDLTGKKRQAFLVSADGTRVRLGLGAGATDPVLVDLGAETVTEASSVPLGLAAPNTAGLPITNWENNDAPRLAGKPIELDRFETSRSLAVRPDRTGFILGAEWALRSFAPGGEERWRKEVPAVAWGVDLARDGELVVAAYGDGTIRWHRWSDGEELLALFISPKDKRWLAWTPTGYYMASPGAESLIGWHLNRGWEQPADFFPVARFRDRFYRPDIVHRVLETLDEGTAIAEADAARSLPAAPRPASTALTRLPPVVRIVGPAAGSRFTSTEFGLDYELRSPSGLAVDRIEVLVDGVPLAGTRGLERIQGNDLASPAAVGAAGVLSGHVTLTLPPRSVEVTLTAYAATLRSEPATIKLAWAGTSTPVAVPKPTLYALVVGVSTYADARLNLNFAGKDARDFAAALRRQKGGLYDEVEIKLLTDAEASRDGIVDGLVWLRRSVTSRDVGLVYFAGHGLTDAGNFWFVPTDATPDRIESRGIGEADINRTLNGLAGKALLFLDACHAASALGSAKARDAVDVNAFVNRITDAGRGVVAFAAAQGQEVSMESTDWGNGAFTKAILETMSGQGRVRSDGGDLTLSLLDYNITERVKQLTDGRQHPVMIRPSTISDFPFAIVRN